MNLDVIMKMWESDSTIDRVLLDEASLKIPQMHQKYLMLHSEFSILHKDKIEELKLNKHKKYLFYSGKASPEEYQNNPFPHKILKGDVHNWITVDKEIIQLEKQLEYYNIVIHNLNEILKQVHQMSFNIRNAIEYRKFTGGL